MKRATVLMMLVMMATTAAWTITLRQVAEEEWREYKVIMKKAEYF